MVQLPKISVLMTFFFWYIPSLQDFGYTAMIQNSTCALWKKYAKLKPTFCFTANDLLRQMDMVESSVLAQLKVSSTQNQLAVPWTMVAANPKPVDHVYGKGLNCHNYVFLKGSTVLYYFNVYIVLYQLKYSLQWLAKVFIDNK